MLLIAISVFSLFHPLELAVKTQDPPATHVLRVGDSSLPFTTSGEWTLSVPGKIERKFRGRLEITEQGGELLAVVYMDIETAVASVVAAEIPPGAPMEALRAQAVAARSFLMAAKDRHRGFDFCDTTHCQFLRQPPDPPDAAFRAAESTRGLTLQYRGQTIAASYSADCGGHTKASSPGLDGYAYVRVTCPRQSGSRRGHGIGLCQLGAADLAAAGKGYLAILEYYYPGAVVR
jgi:peptidoglycan hydrolase-like amidase